MKYIPGDKFVNYTTQHTKLFKRNTLYVLHNVQMEDNGIKYTFKVNNELKEVTFANFEEADIWLEQIVYN